MKIVGRLIELLYLTALAGSCTAAIVLAVRPELLAVLSAMFAGG